MLRAGVRVGVTELLQSLSREVDPHNWELSWDSRGLCLRHEDRRLVLQVLFKLVREELLDQKHKLDQTLQRSQEKRVMVRGEVLELSPDTAEYARRFYARLRELDQSGTTAIYIEMPPDTPEWAAVRDRITRATQPLP